MEAGFLWRDQRHWVDHHGGKPLLVGVATPLAGEVHNNWSFSPSLLQKRERHFEVTVGWKCRAKPEYQNLPAAGGLDKGLLLQANSRQGLCPGFLWYSQTL